MRQNTIVKQSDIKREWFLVDASDMILGRLSTQLACLLRGKNKNNFINNMDLGDYVVLINAKKIKFSKESKWDSKKYYNHSHYMGGLRTRTARIMYDKYLIEMIKRSVYGMLPKNKLAKKQINRLFIYENNEHNNIAQKPKKYEIQS